VKTYVVPKTIDRELIIAYLKHRVKAKKGTLDAVYVLRHFFPILMTDYKDWTQGLLKEDESANLEISKELL
jgi:hypothetical protein